MIQKKMPGSKDRSAAWKIIFEETKRKIAGIVARINGTAGRISGIVARTDGIGEKMFVTVAKIDGIAGKMCATAGKIGRIAGRINGIAARTNGTAKRIFASTREIGASIEGRSPIEEEEEADVAKSYVAPGPEALSVLTFVDQAIAAV